MSSKVSDARLSELIASMTNIPSSRSPDILALLVELRDYRSEERISQHVLADSVDAMATRISDMEEAVKILLERMR